MLWKTVLSSYTYESINTNNVSAATLEKIFEIEQDMWSRGIWEYVKCNDCGKNFSKSEIYNDTYIKRGISKSLLTQTVMQIEEYLGELPVSPCCKTDTEHIYNRVEYMWEIEKRYSSDESFLTIARNREEEIVWFIDWYIATLEEIFTNEFRFHFSHDLLELICQQYEVYRETKMLTVSSIGTDDQNKSLLVTLSLLKYFFENLDEKYDDISGIVESIIWSSTYCIFSLMRAKKLWLQRKTEYFRDGKINENFKTDILFQPSVVWQYKRKFNIGIRDIVRYSRDFQLSQSPV